MLRLRLQNGFELVENDHAITGFRTKKTKALFVYLVLADTQPVIRSKLQTLFWGDFTHTSAQASLRVALSNLRQLFGHIEGLLTIEPQVVYLDRSHNQFWCDLLHDETVFVSQPFLPELHNLGSRTFQSWLEEMAGRYVDSADKRPPRTNIGRALEPLYGREADIERVRTRLLQHATPLVTITGVGGVGKTQLALAVGRSVVDQFKHGIWFVSLATLTADDDDAVTATIAEILRQLQIKHGDQRSPREQLFTYLHSRSLLLILDNVEQLLHLTHFAAFLLDLLARAPQVQLLLTSRKRLAIPAEWAYGLSSLPIPAETHGTTVQSLLQFTSVQLFVEKAQRVWLDFTLTKQNVQDVADICRLVDGVPLGIELAAAQIVWHAAAEIAAMLSTSLASVHSEAVSPRHANLTVVFDQSWRLLTPHLQQMLIACALFRGDFALKSALVVTGGTADQLFQLVQHALIQQVAPARFALHPIIGEFIEQKLQLSSRRAELEHRFATHYLAMLAEQSLPLLKLATRTPIKILMRELTHIRMAWRLAVQQQNFRALAEAVDALHLLFGRFVGQYPTGIALLAAADIPAAPQSLRHAIGIWTANLHALTGETAAGIARVREVTQIATAPRTLARAYNIWGLLLSFEEAFESAETRLAQAWQHAQDPHDTILQHERISILVHQAYVYKQLEQHQRASELAQQALTLTQAGGYVYWEMALLYNQARYDVYHFRYDRALSTLLPLIERGEKLQLVQSVITLLATRCHCHLELGEPHEALTTIQQARHMLDESALGTWYTLYIGRYTIDCLLLHQAFDQVRQLSEQLLLQVENQTGYMHEKAYLIASYAQLATDAIPAARALFCHLDPESLASMHNLDYYDVAVQLGLAENDLQTQTVDALIEAVNTSVNTLFSLRVYQTIVAGLAHLDDPRLNGYQQIARDALDSRAAQIADPKLRRQYIAHQQTLYFAPS